MAGIEDDGDIGWASGGPQPAPVVEEGRVKEVCKVWSVIEDSALAHKLQEEEIAMHYTKNVSESQVLREDILKAKMLQDEEDRRAGVMTTDEQFELERQDCEYARMIQERLENGEIDDAADPATAGDEEFARELQRQESLKRQQQQHQSKHRSRSREKQLDRERRRVERLMEREKRELIALASMEHNVNEQPSSPEHDNTSQITTKTTHSSKELDSELDHLAQLQIKDEDITEPVQDADHDLSVDTDQTFHKDQIVAKEIQDRELARYLQEREIARLERRKQRQQRRLAAAASGSNTQTKDSSTPSLSSSSSPKQRLTDTTTPQLSQLRYTRSLLQDDSNTNTTTTSSTNKHRRCSDTNVPHVSRSYTTGPGSGNYQMYRQSSDSTHHYHQHHHHHHRHRQQQQQQQHDNDDEDEDEEGEKDERPVDNHHYHTELTQVKPGSLSRTHKPTGSTQPSLIEERGGAYSRDRTRRSVDGRRVVNHDEDRAKRRITRRQRSVDIGEIQAAYHRNTTTTNSQTVSHAATTDIVNYIHREAEVVGVMNGDCLRSISPQSVTTTETLSPSSPNSIRSTPIGLLTQQQQQDPWNIRRLKEPFLQQLSPTMDNIQPSLEDESLSSDLLNDSIWTKRSERQRTQRIQPDTPFQHPAPTAGAITKATTLPQPSLTTINIPAEATSGKNITVVSPPVQIEGPIDENCSNSLQKNPSDSPTSPIYVNGAVTSGRSDSSLNNVLESGGGGGNTHSDVGTDDSDIPTPKLVHLSVDSIRRHPSLKQNQQPISVPPDQSTSLSAIASDPLHPTTLDTCLKHDPLMRNSSVDGHSSMSSQSNHSLSSSRSGMKDSPSYQRVISDQSSDIWLRRTPENDERFQKQPPPQLTPVSVPSVINRVTTENSSSSSVVPPRSHPTHVRQRSCPGHVKDRLDDPLPNIPTTTDTETTATGTSRVPVTDLCYPGGSNDDTATASTTSADITVDCSHFKGIQMPQLKAGQQFNILAAIDPTCQKSTPDFCTLSVKRSSSRCSIPAVSIDDPSYDYKVENSTRKRWSLKRNTSSNHTRHRNDSCRQQ